VRQWQEVQEVLRTGCPTEQLVMLTDAVDHLGSRESLDSTAGNVTPLAATRQVMARSRPRLLPFAPVAITGVVASGPGVAT